jgi:S-adenosylmethionine synthetase
MLGEWILTAWEIISSESVVTGFNKCCISNATDGTEDNILRQDKDNRVIVKMAVVVAMKSKVRMRTVNNNLSFQIMS